MKIQCDVCNKKEASVFCTADEAALCDVCDQRVHHANKLASKHQRFSLVQPSLSRLPICDICQEKRALLFCQEDRAILCRECDIPLHTANEYTQQHNRFLLTGIKLSTNTACDHTKTKIISDVITANRDVCDTTVPDYNKLIKTSNTHDDTNNNNNNNNNKMVKSTVNCVNDNNNNNEVNNNSGGSSNDSSNISDYLIETLPGWHFDDFVLDPTSSSLGFSNKMQSGNNNNGFEDLSSFFDVEQYEKNFTITNASYATQSLESLWVPQAPLAATTTTTFDKAVAPTFQCATSGFIQGTKQQETSVNAFKFSRRYNSNDAFTVPQITPSHKRSRPFW